MVVKGIPAVCQQGSTGVREGMSRGRGPTVPYHGQRPRGNARAWGSVTGGGGVRGGAGGGRGAEGEVGGYKRVVCLHHEGVGRQGEGGEMREGEEEREGGGKKSGRGGGRRAGGGGEEEREEGEEEWEEGEEAMEESPMVVGEGVEPSGASWPWRGSSSVSDRTFSSSGLSRTSISGVSLIKSSTERLLSSSTGDITALWGYTVQCHPHIYY